MRLEIKIEKEIIDFCKLNDIDLVDFIYDCVEKGFIQNKWGKSPLDQINPVVVDKTPKNKGVRKKKDQPTKQKKSEPVKQIPTNDIYGED